MNIQENALENVVWKLVAIVSRPQCVDTAASTQDQTMLLAIIYKAMNIQLCKIQQTGTKYIFWATPQPVFVVQIIPSWIRLWIFDKYICLEVI